MRGKEEEKFEGCRKMFTGLYSSLGSWQANWQLAAGCFRLQEFWAVETRLSYLCFRGVAHCGLLENSCFVAFISELVFCPYGEILLASRRLIGIDEYLGEECCRIKAWSCIFRKLPSHFRVDLIHGQSGIIPIFSTWRATMGYSAWSYYGLVGIQSSIWR